MDTTNPQQKQRRSTRKLSKSYKCYPRLVGNEFNTFSSTRSTGPPGLKTRNSYMLNGNNRSHAAAQFHGQQNMQQDQEDYYNRHGPQGFSGGRGDGRRYRGR